MVFVGRDLNDHPVPSPCPGQICHETIQLTSKTFRDETSTTSLRNLSQCLTILTLKNFFLIFGFFLFFFFTRQCFTFWSPSVIYAKNMTHFYVICDIKWINIETLLSSIQDNFQWYMSGVLPCLWWHVALPVIKVLVYEVVFCKCIHWALLFKAAGFREKVYQVLPQKQKYVFWHQVIKKSILLISRMSDLWNLDTSAITWGSFVTEL